MLEIWSKITQNFIVVSEQVSFGCAALLIFLKQFAFLCSTRYIFCYVCIQKGNFDFP